MHAPKDGDATITAEARAAVERGDTVTVITADRLLASAVNAVGAIGHEPVLAARPVLIRGPTRVESSLLHTSSADSWVEVGVESSLLHTSSADSWVGSGSESSVTPHE